LFPDFLEVFALFDNSEVLALFEESEVSMLFDGLELAPVDGSVVDWFDCAGLDTNSIDWFAVAERSERLALSRFRRSCSSILKLRSALLTTGPAKSSSKNEAAFLDRCYCS
jgi:hypothetical protein